MGRSFAPPELSPLSDGSVDLHWVSPTWELLINVPTKRAQPISYYGDDRGVMYAKGSLDVRTLCGPLLSWLAAGPRKPR